MVWGKGWGGQAVTEQVWEVAVPVVGVVSKAPVKARGLECWSWGWGVRILGDEVRQ